MEELKLFLCSVNCIDYEFEDIQAASTQDKAKSNFLRKLDEEGIWYAGDPYIEEVKLEGYEIFARKIQKTGG